MLAASLASVPIFLSSAGTQAVAVQAAERCPTDTGATYVVPPRSGSVLGAPDPFTPLADNLGPSTQWARIETSLQGADPSAPTNVVVLYRDEALANVEVLERTGRPGLWLSDRAVEMTGVDTSETNAVLGGVPMPIAGVYRDLAAGTIADPYWCAHASDLLLEVRGGDLVPPDPIVIADRESFFSLEGLLGSSVEVQAAWEARLRGDVTVSEVDTLVEELACDGDEAPELAWCKGGRPAVVSDPVPRATLDDRMIEAPDADSFVRTYFGSSLPFVADRAGAIQTAVGGGIWPVAALAAVAGGGLVAATASLWFDRRQREVALLTVRGVSPAGIALKAMFELTVPLVLGSAAGVFLAFLLVVWFGPSSTLEPAAIVRAVWVGAAALLISALAVAVVVALRARASHAVHSSRRWLRVVPWELALGLATAVSYARLGEWGAPVSRGAQVTRVDIVGLMFPVLFLTTVVAVVARLLVLALRPLRALTRDRSTSMFLAARRVARYRVAVIGLVAASAVAAGVFGYAATIHRSMDETLQAKARTFLGSDVAVRMAKDEQIPPALQDQSTFVDVYRSAWLDLARREQVNVFAIDPTSFSQAAFWDDSLASSSLDDILERLAAPPSGGQVPALVVGLDVPATAEAGIVTQGTTRFEIAEIADAQAFPGMRRGSPAMFISADALEDLGVSTSVREVWIRGERDEVLATLDEAGTSYQETSTVAQVADQVSFLTVSSTFGFMQSLGVVAAVLVVGGLAVYLDARRRGRVLAYAFARRMGLTRRQHRWALLAEVVAGVVVGCWLGLVVALVGAGVAHERIDPVPSYRPDPLLRPATGIMVGVGLAALVLAWIAAALAQRATDRDDPVEVLRAGT